MSRYKRAYIEITNVCNLACSFCPGTVRPPRFMSVAEFETVLDRLYGTVGEVYLHVMGEPLLHPQLDALLDCCERVQMPVKLTTNGVLLIRTGDVLLDRSMLRQINISLHCYAGNAMEIAYEQYCAQVFDFVRKLRGNSQNCVVMLRMWNDCEDPAAVLQRQRTAEIILREFGVDVTQPTPHANGHRLGERYWIQTAERFDWPSESAGERGERGFCQGLRTHFGVLCDGTVVPCCLDSNGVMPLGNLFETSLEEIMHSRTAREIYEGFSEGRAVKPLCRRCGYRTRFR